MKELTLDRGWRILQDVHGLGEELGLYNPGFDPTDAGRQISEWEKLTRLAHLQTVLADNPYFGRELRHFNQAPWWYRLEFSLPDGCEAPCAALRFEAADYYCKVWLNGRFLGSHEGYATPFEFGVTGFLKRGEPNLLVAKVWSPWDTEVSGGNAKDRTFNVIRGMAKGTYEHGDTFIQRDVNPVGIWKPVRLLFHEGLRIAGKLHVSALPLPEGSSSAEVTIAVPLEAERPPVGATLFCRIADGETGEILAQGEKAIELDSGSSTADVTLHIERPRLWSVWDRGEQPLYRAEAELREEGRTLCRSDERFGIRTVELIRTQEDTVFMLNGRRLFLRGTAYFPDVYLSEMHEARCRRDMELAKSAGFNAIRVHVHTPPDCLLDICDELGLVVLQDFDVNWVHPAAREWSEGAAAYFGEVVRELRNHPSILAWVCTNEPSGGVEGSMLNEGPGPQLVEAAARLDPLRPVIRGSGAWGDPVLSGDTHNYIGSLDGHGTHYTDIFNKPSNKWGFPEKLNTEFGFDAPGAPANLRRMAPVHERLKGLGEEGINQLQYYQYRLLKYFIEHYRMMKYAPCSGYFQFMLIDLCPQSFYGVYDWWGMPKEGARALRESNGPMGVFMLYRDRPGRLFAANDTLMNLVDCTAEWTAADGAGNLLCKGSARVDLPQDSLVEFQTLDFPVRPGERVDIHLTLRDPSGNLLAQNRYEDAFNHPPHPKGHPERMSHELGMRLYWA